MKKQIEVFWEFQEWEMRVFDCQNRTVNLNFEDMESKNAK